MTTTVRGIVWVDSNGGTRLTTPRANASLSTIQTDMLAKSNAGVAFEWEGAQSGSAGSPSVATYQTTRDAAVLVFQTSTCEQVKLLLPAPKSSIFMTDQETVDPAQVTTLIADCLGVLCTPAGTVVTEYIAGYRIGSPGIP